MKLVTDKGKWALKDNSMIFGNVVWLCNEKDINQYHLIDNDHNEIILNNDIKEFIVND